MGNLSIALTFVLVLNALMFMYQAAIIDMNPEAPLFFNYEGSMLENFDQNKDQDNPALDSDSSTDNLPNLEGEIDTSTGNFFTDMFSSTKKWFAETTGLYYLMGIVTAPYNILKAMNLPNAFVFAMGTLWYGLTLFFVVAFFWGRD